MLAQIVQSFFALLEDLVLEWQNKSGEEMMNNLNQAPSGTIANHTTMNQRKAIKLKQNLKKTMSSQCNEPCIIYTRTHSQEGEINCTS